MDQNTTLINITIDQDLRTLTISTNGTVFGVVGDISVNRVMFVLPRYLRGFNLTQCVARVNYCNLNGDANYYEADDLADTEGKATFTWLMVILMHTDIIKQRWHISLTLVISFRRIWMISEMPNSQVLITAIHLIN